MSWHNDYQAVAEWAANVLVSWCCKMYHCQVHDAENAVQEALAKSWECQHQFRENSDAQLRKWLMTTAKNSLVNGFRTTNRQRSLDDLDASQEPVVEKTDHAHEATLDDLHKALEELPSKDRNLIKLYYFEKLTLKEIAGRLGVVASTVHCRIHLILVQLRNKL